MKNLLFISLLLLFSCNKKNKTTTPTSTPTSTPTTPASKQVKVFITYGSPNNFCSIKWKWDDLTTTTIDESVDSSYVSDWGTSGSLNRVLTNTTTSDSIFIYANSYITSGQTSNSILVTSNGVVKAQFSEIQTQRIIRLD